MSDDDEPDELDISHTSSGRFTAIKAEVAN